MKKKKTHDQRLAMVHSAVALLETIFGGGAVTGNIMPVHYKSVKHILVCVQPF